MHSCSFSEIFFGYSRRTEAAVDQLYIQQWQLSERDRKMKYCAVLNCSNSSKVANVTFHKFPIGQRSAQYGYNLLGERIPGHPNQGLAYALRTSHCSAALQNVSLL
jgi:hypothetical protein